MTTQSDEVTRTSSPDELDELRRTARAMLDRDAPTTAVRSLLDDPRGYDPALWRAMAELGWLGLLAPVAHGGAGAGLTETVVVAEQLGAHLVASPFLASAVLATSALALGGTPTQQERWLPALANGAAIGTAALTGSLGRADGAASGVTLERTGTSVRLDGVVRFVPDAHVADVIVLAAHDGEERALVAIETAADGVRVEPTPTIDHTRRLNDLHLDGVVVDDAALLEADVTDDVLLRGVVALAADGVGAAREILTRAVEYAKERVQFGRPIGSFQAVKHMLANMYVLTEAASVAVEGAAEAFDADASNAARLAEIAASYARDAAVKVAGDAVQAHGGIGFTWEHDCHLFLKRTQLGAALLGDPAEHRERLAALMLAAARDQQSS